MLAPGDEIIIPTLDQLAPYRMENRPLWYKVNGHMISYYEHEIPFFGRKGTIDAISPGNQRAWVKITDVHGYVHDIPVFLELLKPIKKRKIYWKAP